MGRGAQDLQQSSPWKDAIPMTVEDHHYHHGAVAALEMETTVETTTNDRDVVMMKNDCISDDIEMQHGDHHGHKDYRKSHIEAFLAAASFQPPQTIVMEASRGDINNHQKKMLPTDPQHQQDKTNGIIVSPPLSPTPSCTSSSSKSSSSISSTSSTSSSSFSSSSSSGSSVSSLTSSEGSSSSLSEEERADALSDSEEDSSIESTSFSDPIDGCTLDDTSQGLDEENSTTTKEKKNVRFHGFVEVAFIETRKEMSKRVQRSYYYTSYEMTLMRDREKQMIREFSAHGTLNYNMMSQRKYQHDDILGLEGRTARNVRRQRIKDAVCSVLLEQELLVKTTKCDADSVASSQKQHRNISGMDRSYGIGDDSDLVLAEVYQEYTIVSTRLAIDRAKGNAIQVGRSDETTEDVTEVIDEPQKNVSSEDTNLWSFFGGWLSGGNNGRTGSEVTETPPAQSHEYHPTPVPQPFVPPSIPVSYSEAPSQSMGNPSFSSEQQYDPSIHGRAEESVKAPRRWIFNRKGRPSPPEQPCGTQPQSHPSHSFHPPVFHPGPYQYIPPHPQQHQQYYYLNQAGVATQAPTFYGTHVSSHPPVGCRGDVWDPVTGQHLHVPGPQQPYVRWDVQYEIERVASF